MAASRYNQKLAFVIRGNGTNCRIPPRVFDRPRADSLRKVPTIMSVTTSRREFLGQGAQVLGLLAWAGHQPVNAFAGGLRGQELRRDIRAGPKA